MIAALFLPIMPQEASNVGNAAPAGLAGRQDALEAFLVGAAEAKSTSVRELRPLTGGAIQENWFAGVEIDGGPFAGIHELVLRKDAPSSVAASHSRAREFALLKVAWQAGVTVPEPLWLCTDSAVLGQPFYLMRKVAGVAAGHLLVKETGPVTDGEALAERLGQELARIHSIRPPQPDLAFLEQPEPDPARFAVALYRRYLDALRTPQPALEWGLRWCELHAPLPGEIVLVHQDFRTGNYMVADGELTAVLDWEFCAWGDPMSDLGWFCAKCRRFGRDDKEAGGIGSRGAFYRGYEAKSGRRVEPEVVAYWEVMAHLRWAVIALQQGARFSQHGERSLDLALTGRIRPDELAWQILQMTPPERWKAGTR